MIKKLLVVAVVLAIAWSIPEIRDRMARVAEPVLERLGPVGDKAADPVRAYNTRNEIVVLVRALKREHDMRRPLPNARSFAAWLEQNTESGRGGKDAWGNTYYLQQDRLGVTIGSPGPDGEVGTADDITRTMPY